MQILKMRLHCPTELDSHRQSQAIRAWRIETILAKYQPRVFQEPEADATDHLEQVQLSRRLLG